MSKTAKQKRRQIERDISKAVAAVLRKNKVPRPVMFAKDLVEAGEMILHGAYCDIGISSWAD